MVASPAERRAELNRRYPEWQRQTLAQHFRDHCAMYAERPMLLTPSAAWTYGDVWRETVRVAKALLALGVRRRDHVAVLLANEPEFVTVKLAIAVVGAVCVPLNTMLREDELDYMLRQSDARWLILHQTAVGTDHAESVSRLLQGSRGGDLPLRVVQAVCIPNTDRPLPPVFLPWADFVQAGDSIPDGNVEHLLEAKQYPDEVCDIVYTSGSTGLPKGVMLTHQHILRCGFSSALSRAYEDGRRIFIPLPLYHVFAYVEGLSALSFVGGALIIPPAFRPKQALEMMEKYQATDMLCVPSILLAVLNHPDRPKHDLSSLFALMCAAAPAPIPVWQQAVEAFGLQEICTGYGGTEVSAATAHTEIGDSLERITTRVGRLKPGGSSGLPEFGWRNTEYKTIDPDTLEDLPEGAVGELVVRGNIVSHGYYNKPDETGRTIDKDGWLRTGDLGRIDEDGYIEFLGRSKEMYKVSGENVSPREIEDVITRHPGVRQAYVVGVPDKLTTETGAAFVECREGVRLTRREVIQWCQERLAKFKIPRYVWFMQPGDWPMTGTGKIQKFKLQEMALNKLSRDEEPAATE
ncbi:MAG: AMP-binding protein [Alicyclobacillus sp.]|nr:AMP-binding protein [Alicyclobacillus sp.]